MSRLSPHQLDRRLEKLESMPNASVTHVIIVTFGDHHIDDQIVCQGNVYLRLAGEVDSAFKNRIMSGASTSVSPVVILPVPSEWEKL